MGLNLDKLRAEADKIDENNREKVEQNQKVSGLLIKHRTQLLNFFRELFPEDTISIANGGQEIIATFGEIKISMTIVTLRSAHKGGSLVLSPTIDPIFTKTVADKKIFSLKLVDVTKYSELTETLTEIEFIYKYQINDKIYECKFSDIESILQMIIDYEII